MLTIYYQSNIFDYIKLNCLKMKRIKFSILAYTLIFTSILFSIIASFQPVSAGSIPVSELRRGLAIYLPFDTNTNDYSTREFAGYAPIYNNNHGNIVGDVDLVPGVVGFGYQLANQYGYIQVPDFEIATGGGFSVGLWAKFVGGEENPFLWTSCNGNCDYIQHSLAIARGNEELFSEVNGVEVTTETNISMGDWHYFVMTYDEDNSIFYYYVDSVLVKIQPFESSGFLPGDMYIGFEPINNQQLYGNVDEFAIWRRILVQEEIDALYNSGEGFSLRRENSYSTTELKSGILGYWPFDIDTKDYSGNANHGVGSNLLFRDGKVNSSYSFNGSSSFVSTPLNINGLSSGTWGGWFNPRADKLDGATDSQYILSAFLSGSDFHLGLEGFNIDGSQEQNGIQLLNIKQLVDSSGTWYSLYMTWGPEGRFLFLNGKVVAHNPSTSPIIAPGNITIGKSTDINEDQFSGLIDEVGVWNRQLTYDEIIFMHNDGDGITLQDSSVIIPERALLNWHFEDSEKRALVPNGGSVTAYGNDLGEGSLNLSGPAYTSWSIGSGGSGTNAPGSNGWANGFWWQVSTTSKDFEDLYISSKQRGSSTGPRDFRIEYSIDGSNWTAVSGGDITVRDNFTSGVVNRLALPIECENQETLYLRWLVVSNTSVSDALIGITGTNRIDDILLEGSLKAYTLNYSVDAEKGYIDGEAVQVVYAGYSGSRVRVYANEGYVFTGWDDGYASGMRTDYGSADLNVEALFDINIYNLEYFVDANGTLTGITNQNVEHGSDGTEVVAVANEGYHFVQWSDGVLTANRTDLALVDNLSVSAEFAINEYNLTYLVDAFGGGNLIGNVAQIVEHGSDGTEVTAVANDGFHFVRWSDEETNPTRTDLNITSEVTIYAIFDVDRYTITNIDESLRLEILEEGFDLEVGIPVGSEVTVLIYDIEGNLVGSVRVQFDTDINFSDVTADTNLSTGMAYVHGLGSEFTLYIPKLSSHTMIAICPGASNLEILNTNCPNIYYLYPNSSNVSIENIEGVEYWVISGLEGTGGFGIVGTLSATGSNLTSIVSVYLLLVTFVLSITGLLLFVNSKKKFAHKS
jgi:hypothetical protein